MAHQQNPNAMQQQHDSFAPIVFTQAQIEACLLRGLSKWEIVAELQTNHQIKQHTVLDVWNRLEAQNNDFFRAYEQFIRLRNQMQDFTDVTQKLVEENKESSYNNGAGMYHQQEGYLQSQQNAQQMGAGYPSRQQMKGGEEMVQHPGFFESFPRGRKDSDVETFG